MNGRIYDPHLARFLQADPFMEDTGTLNRYTYVLNNPMMYTDPSGYFTDDPLRFMVAVIATAVTYGTAAPYFAGLAAAGTISATTATVLTFATVGFVSGGIATGSLEGAFTGAVVGGLTGGMAGAGWDFGAQLLGRALIGGTVSHVQGGKFGHGFLAAGASFAASPAISNITSDVGAQMLGEMIVGGTISEATGGSFANGAIASAVAFATGKVLSQSDDLPTNEEIMQMSDAELDAWIASRANLEFDPSTAIAWQWGDPLPQNIVDFGAGLGDALSFTLTRRYRDWRGIDAGINRSSTAYTAGSWSAAAVGGGRLVYMGAAKGYSIIAPSGAAASAFRETLKRPGRLWLGKKWRQPDLSRYSSDAALRAAAGRTNPYINFYGAGVTVSGAAGPCYSDC